MSDTAVPETPVSESFAAFEVDVDPRLLEVLVCPVTQGPLELDRARGELVSRRARLAYPIRDGVPIMLPEEARELAESE
jgi:uncharacterized protein YbaR (Trm112 family)